VTGSTGSISIGSEACGGQCQNLARSFRLRRFGWNRPGRQGLSRHAFFTWCALEFTSADVERIRSLGHVAEVEVHSEIGSTNDRAIERALEQTLRCPCLILADRQTAGRGRGGNLWWSAPGALTFSLVLEPRRVGLATEAFPQVALAAGLAACEAIEQILPQASPRLKWPNDVFLCGKKVSGILLESPRADSGRLIVGVGLNVNNSLAAAPVELRETAVSMIDVTGRPLDRTAVLIAVLERLDAWLRALAVQPREVFERWRRNCLLTGKRVCLKSGIREIEGLCRGIDESGRLLISTPRGIEAHRSGTVTAFG
jgi:BirA family transcriptional regulator, biotin operon repressor / biotin---[acetyl-CoA-carboxylase] ligase